MKSRSNKVTEPKKSRDSLNTSNIQKYLKDPLTKSPTIENKQQSTKDKKKDPLKNKGVVGGTSRGDTSPEHDLDLSSEPSIEVLPTKTEIQEMFGKLEKVLKAEVLNLRTDLGYLLKRVEVVEEVTEQHTVNMEELKTQIQYLQTGQRELLLKLEEQENQNRRQNLRIRALPERRGEDLFAIMKEIFNPLLGRDKKEDLKVDRVHRVRKPPNMKEEIPRDIIVRFHQYEDKDKIWKSLRGAQPVKYDNSDIQIFADLSARTLARRRKLRPLLEWEPRQISLPLLVFFLACCFLSSIGWLLMTAWAGSFG